MELNALIAKLKEKPPKRVAVAAAEDDVVLMAVAEAAKLGIAVPVLCGNAGKIKALAAETGVDISGFELVKTENDQQSAAAAVTLVRDGKADMLMKGLLQTADLLRAVLNKENGLRGGGILSHVAAIHSEAMGRTWIVTDGGMVMYPDLKTKAQLIESAVKVARGLGVEMPKVAVLAAVETINPEMPATLDAAALTAMNRRGQIKNCVVDGPLAFDLAVSPEAVKHKKVDSPVAGQADILLFPNIEAGNAVVKAMTNIGGCIFGGVVMGASAPVVMTSRSDSDISKLYSIAIAASV
jgi:phosphate butyryltransferase